jgi:HEPN domain-containing protein
MAESQLIDEWIKKAEEDYQFAASVLEDTTFYAQICFHFHQAAEKYLKAFIVARDLEFQRIHDLLVLWKLCSAAEPGFGEIQDDANFSTGSILIPVIPFIGQRITPRRKP